MSFRNRLTLFFVAIVIVPMLSVAFVLFSLIADNENGKADARLAARQQLAVNLYRSDVEAAGRIATRVGADRAARRPRCAPATTTPPRRARELLAELGAVRIRIEDRQGERVDVGRGDAVAPARRELVDAGGSRFGVLTVSDRSAPVFARQVKQLTGLDVVVRQGDRSSPRPSPARPRALPDVGDDRRRRRGLPRRLVPRARLRRPPYARLAALVAGGAARRTSAQPLLAGGVLAGFFLLAIICAFLVSRSLSAQIGSFLDAARRLGRGDFSAQVPTQGRDEFAALGGEFNRMALQLQHRLQELQTERLRLENAMRRLGEAFASASTASALLEIAVRTAVDGVDADGGRAVLADGDGEARAAATPAPRGARRRGRARGAGRRRAARGARRRRAARWPTRWPAPSGGAGRHRVGVAQRPDVHRRRARPVPLPRRARPRLARQRRAARDRPAPGGHRRAHRAVQPPPLPGGAAQEIERARRFGQGLGLVMLDIDNFKQVNDTYGHQVGDLVLAEVARVLREYSREIDEPARYGGEELAVVLPGTDLEGAYNLAERVRAGIEALEFPLDGRGTLRVTASFGAAAMPESAERPVLADRGRRHRALRGQAVGQEPHRAGRAGTRPAHSVTCRGTWDCSTTRSESTWSSSASTAPTRPRSSARSVRRSAPRSAPRGRAAPRRARARRCRLRRPDDDVPEADVAPGRSRRRPSPTRSPSRRSTRSPTRARTPRRRPIPSPPPEPSRSARPRPPPASRPADATSTSSGPTPREPRPRARGRGRRGGGRPGGDPGLPPGDARARPPLVRAAAPARLRLLRPTRRSPGSTSSRPSALTGNQLAVVHDADGVDDATMLAFARETRLSETTFVQTPTADGADYRNRICMMSGELDFAGHPSLGTAVAVALARGEGEASYVQQTPAGLQPIDVERARRRDRACVDAPERRRRSAPSSTAARSPPR